MAPLVSRMSIVNITIVPGTACEKPAGGSLRLPALLTESVSCRGAVVSAASDSRVNGWPAAFNAARSATTV